MKFNVKNYNIFVNRTGRFLNKINIIDRKRFIKYK